ncbi:hypothetical protein AV530_015600 [Patagioenas fasciata monilis]|uniref:Uncharacterized protein n=1 Tax=Patagioenas fasciata monilis TaxID=372326 RepID=A0A1V4KI77_PATFA|nr:hypothetical protein AV530_015600 [Patagioenas fasciata monilis]
MQPTVAEDAQENRARVFKGKGHKTCLLLGALQCQVFTRVGSTENSEKDAGSRQKGSPLTPTQRPPVLVSRTNTPLRFGKAEVPAASPPGEEKPSPAEQIKK